MAHISKVVVRQDGWLGGPGFLTFYTSDPVPNLTGLASFFNSLKVYAAPGVGWTFPGTGYIVDDATGHATGTWSQTAPSAVGSIGSGSYAAPAGCCFTWATGALNSKGHLIRGRTFFVPGSSPMFQNNGTLDDTFRSAALGYAATMYAAFHLVVFKRPWTKTSADGTSAAVNSVTLSDQAAVLRSRRA